MKKIQKIYNKSAYFLKNFYEKIFYLVAQYALSKTLRFEIKPSKITRQNLETQKILILDTKKQKAYQELKPLFDALHNKFIAESCR